MIVHAVFKYADYIFNKLFFTHSIYQH